MRIILLCLAFLHSLPAHAEKISVFDQYCVANEVRACIGQVLKNKEVLSCENGELPDNSNICTKVYPYNIYSQQRPEKFQEAFLFCEKVVHYSMAPSKCSHVIDIPSSAQLDTFNKNFNDNFVRALEKAFTEKTGSSAAPATPASAPAPAKP
ncbi:MAG TPA: hypothetical protein DDY39_10815 [Nitrospira sp.]|nr:hypothetical protein [Nitrospira sp.]HBR52002.1 hypothetical protein [Nitrospira sp.]